MKLDYNSKLPTFDFQAALLLNVYDKDLIQPKLRQSFECYSSNIEYTSSISHICVGFNFQHQFIEAYIWDNGLHMWTLCKCAILMAVLNVHYAFLEHCSWKVVVVVV